MLTSKITPRCFLEPACYYLDWKSFSVFSGHCLTQYQMLLYHVQLEIDVSENSLAFDDKISDKSLI